MSDEKKARPHRLGDPSIVHTTDIASCPCQKQAKR